MSTVAGSGDANSQNTSQPGQENLGDGGPALSATMFQPRGIAVANDGTIYFADTGNFRVRRIGTDGVITTIAGSGVAGDSGDGGPATAAQISGVLAIALDPTETRLYLADDISLRVRRVNLTTGTIEHVTGASSPQGIAVATNGQVFVSETVICTISRIDASGQLTPFAGTGICDSTGGAALSANLYYPTRLTIDTAGNVYFVEAGTNTVRRIDAVTTEVTTVAGGGIDLPGSGPATSFFIGPVVTDVAVGAPNELFVSNETQVFRIDEDFEQPSLDRRLLRGGLPPFFLADEFPEREFQEWADAYWAKDVLELFRLERRHSFQRLLELLMAQSGGLFEATVFARACEVSRTTIANYLAVLEATFVVHVVRPFSAGGAAEIVSAPKV